ncbi:MAG: hypothetical protein R6U51_04145 [Anaerolineales bacterium]
MVESFLEDFWKLLDDQNFLLKRRQDQKKQENPNRPWVQPKSRSTRTENLNNRKFLQGT